MAGIAAGLTAASTIAGAVQGYQAQRANRRAADFQRRESQRAYRQEEQRVANLRNTPGAGFTGFGMESILKIFGNSMAGRMTGFNPGDALVAMGVRNEDGSKGPIYGGYNTFMDWRNNAGRSPQPYRDKFLEEKYSNLSEDLQDVFRV